MIRKQSYEPVTSRDVQLQIAREVLQIESRTLAEVSHRLGDEFLDAVDVLFNATGSVIVTGMGKAGLIGQKVTATLASTGTRAHFLHPAEAVHGDLGKISPADVVLAFSHSGETDELNQILPSIATIGATLIGVTSRGQSTLAQRVNVAIVYGNVQEACPIGMAPSTSCSVMLAIGDALAFVLMRMRDFGDEDFGRNHPAGSLGKRMKLVDEIMRQGNQLRIAESSMTVREVFVRAHRPGRRTGAIMLVGPQGELEGLFTDSDLARLFEKREVAAFDQAIGNFMTRQPIALRTGQRVLEALTLIKSYQVSEIPVLDESNRPIGMVDITDLVDLLPEAA